MIIHSLLIMLTLICCVQVYLKTGSLQAYVTRTTGYRTQKAIGKALKRVRKSLDKHNLDYDQVREFCDFARKNTYSTGPK